MRGVTVWPLNNVPDYHVPRRSSIKQPFSDVGLTHHAQTAASSGFRGQLYSLPSRTPRDVNGQLEEVAEYQGWEANSDAIKPPEMNAEERVLYSIKRNADSVLSRSLEAVII